MIIVNFGLAHTIDLFGMRMHIKQAMTISWVVAATRNNAGLASAVAITFLGEKAALPAGVITMSGIIQLLWLDFYYKKILR